MTSRSGGSARSEFRWGTVVTLGVVVGYAAVLVADPRHFYTDDTESQYAPLWVMMGNRIREGRLPMMVPEHWLAGNYTIEEAGLLNPPQWLIALLAPTMDNLALYATLVKLVFAIVLALGVYRICLEYGGKPAWAAVAATSMPFSGWLLFFDSASWFTALTGTAWLTHAWASGVRYARGRSGPIPVFVFLYLTMSVQYVFPAVEAAIVMVAVACGEVLHQRRWRPSVKLLLAAGFAGSAGLATYLPSVLSADVTWRGTAQILNDQFLTVPWSESLNASLPSTLPAFTSWWGYVQPMPVVYIAWFLVPALAFVDWGRARSAWRDLSAVGLFTVIVLMWTAGPGAIGPLRWPARVLPMVALGALVLVCVLLGRFPAGDWRRRLPAAGVLIASLLLRSVSAAPHLTLVHAAAATAVAVLGIAGVALRSRKGVAWACGLAVAAIPPVAFVQVWSVQLTPMSWNLPERRSEMIEAFPEMPGTTLQLADRGLIPPEGKSLSGAYGSLVFGNYAKNLEKTYVGGYTPNGNFNFGEMLCMRWDAGVCPEAFRQAFAVEPTTGERVVDLMLVDRVVLQNALYPDARASPPPSGWKWVDYPGHEEWISVLEREDGQISTGNGRVSATDGVVATSIGESDLTSRVRVQSDDGGRVVFARLGWPGYRATLDGQHIDIDVVAENFVSVDLPAHTDGDLVLSWRPPGWKIGAGAVLLGVAGVSALHIGYVRGRRGTRAQSGISDPAPAPDPDSPIR
ncbi:hypothetical protein [Rhodococcus zopfii]|uniref:hypothetical protein n=1 Tax=Rhodococcus zopfii TaxID=43772 RepID=UPI000A7C8889|nr:hypothetical protein [Rhodococcus zopfii]